MERKRELTWPLIMAVPLLSGSLFALEFLLTRVFSYLVWYHYVFIIVSIAVMGIGLGGLWIQRETDRSGGDPSAVPLPTLMWLLVCSTGVVAVTLYLNLFGFFPLLYVVLGAFPFSVGGAIMSSIFSRLSNLAHVIYFLDLSGTAVFTFASVFVLTRYGMVPSFAILLGAMFAVQILLYASQRRVRLSAIPLGLVMVPLLLPNVDWAGVERNFGNPLGNPDKIGVYLRADDPERRPPTCPIRCRTSRRLY